MAAAAEEKAEPATPLEQMDRLVGGEWHLEGVEKLKAYNTYTWGPTHRVLHFRSYFITPEGNKLRAEGMPEDGSVFGYCDFAAVARGFGLQGRTFTTLDDVPKFVAKMLQSARLTVPS